MMAYKSILFFGGKSEERFVSVASAINLASNYNFYDIWFESIEGTIYRISTDRLVNSRYDYTSDFSVDDLESVGKSLGVVLSSMPADGVVFFLAFHGTHVEDGEMQKVFESFNFSYTGSSSACSEIAFDKNETLKILRKHGVKTANSIVSEDWNLGKAQAFFGNKAIIVKPISGGSSVDIAVFKNPSEVDTSLFANRKFLIEEFIEGREISCGTVQLSTNDEVHALDPVEIIVNHSHFFDYNAKYTSDRTREICPAEIPGEVSRKIKEITVLAHSVLGCYGYSRSDFIYDGESIYFLELNTLPGLTPQSLLTLELKSRNISLNNFIEAQLLGGLKRNSSSRV